MTRKTIDELIAMRLVALGFQESAKLIEHSIQEEELSHNDGGETSPGSHVTKRQKWMALKAVSHFNLGQSFELFLKLILSVEETRYAHIHILTDLYDLLSATSKAQLDGLYDNVKDSMVNKEAGVGFYVGKERPPTLPQVEVSTLRQTFLDFDKNLKLHQRRYQWEDIGAASVDYLPNRLQSVVRPTERNQRVRQRPDGTEIRSTQVLVLYDQFHAFACALCLGDERSRRAHPETIQTTVPDGDCASDRWLRTASRGVLVGAGEAPQAGPRVSRRHRRYCCGCRNRGIIYLTTQAALTVGNTAV